MSDKTKVKAKVVISPTPQDKLARIESMLLATKRALDGAGINWYLGHGVCLGAIREGSILKHDRDIDIIINKEETRVEDVVEALTNAQFTMPKHNKDHLRPKYAGVGGCIYFYSKIDEDFHSVKVSKSLSRKETFILPSIFFKNKENVVINEVEYPTFSPVRLYLEWLYGADWIIQTKKSGFINFSAATVRDIDVAREELRIFKDKYLETKNGGM